MIAANRDVLADARVLDIASHDGRWSFAALQAGAKEVTGIEVRQQLVDSATETFTHYEVDSGRYQFIRGDVFDVLANNQIDVDVVMCLGFLYHTLRFPELLTRLRELRPRHLIIDTNVSPDRDDEAAPVIRLLRDDTSKQQHAADDAYSHNGVTLAGKPSLAAVRQMLEAYDFEVEDVYDWQGLLAAHPSVDGAADYQKGLRVTVRSRPRSSH